MVSGNAGGAMLRRNRKKSRRAFTPFNECDCCPGPTFFGRSAEKRAWKKEADRDR